MLMTVAPGTILSILSFFVNVTYLVVGTLSHGFLATQSELAMCTGSIVGMLTTTYLTFFTLAVLTTVTQYKRFHTKDKRRIITNLFTFPIFMMSYIPINVADLFQKVEWVPTKHTMAVTFDQVTAGDGSSPAA